MPQSLVKPSGIGVEGRQPAHCRRDLLRYIGECIWPSPNFTKIPIMVSSKCLTPLDAYSKAISVARCSTPIICPHKSFAHLYHNCLPIFNAQCLGICESTDTNVWPEFWTELQERGDPRLPGHPMLSNPLWKSQTVGYTIHGDEAVALQIGRSGNIAYDTLSM